MSLLLDRVALRSGADTVIDETSLELDASRINVLLGPTLAGKTTLMRLMAGLDRPSSGRIVIDGRDMADVPVRKRSVAMVYQQFVNYPSLTVYENIASPLRVAGIGRAEIESRVGEAARVLRLEPMLDRLPAQLSGGQQQRTAIARALVKRAKLVLLDEPLANLDYKLREELREELPRLFASTGAIMVYATTEPTEALLLRGATATLSEGRVTQFGTTSALYRAPANVEAARVFSDPPLNEARGRVAGGTIAIGTAAPVTLPAALRGIGDGDYLLGFRVEHAGLTAAVDDAPAFDGTVIATQLSGGESFVHVDVHGARWVCLVRGVHDSPAGTRVRVHLDPRGLFVFGTDGRAVIVPASGRVEATPAAAMPAFG